MRAGQNAFSASRSMTAESLPPENKRTGFSNSAATSRKMCIDSASSASRWETWVLTNEPAYRRPHPPPGRNRPLSPSRRQCPRRAPTRPRPSAPARAPRAASCGPGCGPRRHARRGAWCPRWRVASRRPDRRRSAASSPKPVLGALAGLLDLRGGAVGRALGLGLTVLRRLPCALLDLPLGGLRGVPRLVADCAHGGLLSSRLLVSTHLALAALTRRSGPNACSLLGWRHFGVPRRVGWRHSRGPSRTVAR